MQFTRRRRNPHARRVRIALGPIGDGVGLLTVKWRRSQAGSPLTRAAAPSASERASPARARTARRARQVRNRRAVRGRRPALSLQRAGRADGKALRSRGHLCNSVACAGLPTDRRPVNSMRSKPTCGPDRVSLARIRLPALALGWGSRRMRSNPRSRSVRHSDASRRGGQRSSGDQEGERAEHARYLPPFPIQRGETWRCESATASRSRRPRPSVTAAPGLSARSCGVIPHRVTGFAGTTGTRASTHRPPVVSLDGPPPRRPRDGVHRVSAPSVRGAKRLDARLAPHEVGVRARGRGGRGPRHALRPALGQRRATPRRLSGPGQRNYVVLLVATRCLLGCARRSRGRG
jgi:hypothetical protein